MIVWLLILPGIGYGLYRTNLLNKWLPDYFPAHHSELDLGAEPTSGAPGATIALTVRSAATSLAVTDPTDSNKPQELPAIPVVAGKPVTWTIPADAKVGTTFVISDAVSGTSVKVTVEEKK